MAIGPSTENPTRPLLDWLLAQYPDTPRTRAKQWIVAGRVRVDGAIIRQPHLLIPDPRGTLELLDRRSTALDCGTDGWQIHPRLALLHLDAALAVVNKGAGLVSVPSPDGQLSALSILTDFLAGKLRARQRGPAGWTLPPAYRRLEPLPVHRLDQYTSGVFCMALNAAARRRLVEQVKAHTAQREYVAYVEGRPAQATGTWRNWLQLRADERVQMVVSSAAAELSDGEAVEAITDFEVIEEFRLTGNAGIVTKLRLRLQTGRRHQIRIQAAQAGLPLLGDRTYQPRDRTGKPGPPRIEFDRQALHAELLSLEHPDRPGVRMTWRAPLPADLRRLENELRHGRGR